MLKQLRYISVNYFKMSHHLLVRYLSFAPYFVESVTAVTLAVAIARAPTLSRLLLPFAAAKQTNPSEYRQKSVPQCQ